MTAVRTVIPDDFPPVFDGHPALDRLRERGEVRVYTSRATSEDELAERMRGADVVINVRAFTRFDERLLARLPALRLVAIVGTGADHVDLAAAEQYGVVISNAPGANARSVAEHAIALLFAVARQIPLHDRETRMGEWRHHEGLELQGKTLGIVGLGNIGRTVAHMASAIGLRVIAWSFTTDPERARSCGAELVEFDELLRQADIVSLHVPATPESRGMIGVRELGLLRPGAIFINTARAALVDEPALLAALSSGRLGGAGLDVHNPEPLPPDSPYFGLENVVLTPHIGWVTGAAGERLVQMPIENVLAYLAGTPRFIVDPAALEHPKQAGIVQQAQDERGSG
jgi:phosphoglycerate dehydrogenase-like enzyme